MQAYPPSPEVKSLRPSYQEVVIEVNMTKCIKAGYSVSPRLRAGGGTRTIKIRSCTLPIPLTLAACSPDTRCAQLAQAFAVSAARSCTQLGSSTSAGSKHH